ncbi:hypothetical protein GCM10007276_31170 [Agaricicola taiwanensis]|uniref:Uncharacterized protein n=1 Tax=Agaricicola taiwanensis TaxID=591372 RepID=A0A8J2YLX5_9RHOB|nr:hypothetical protein [Agaricicola taiwanensis]GGE51874.1 hypothetical protein GCM10007276_31170 [Agaricicola taiwanensis]
MYINRFANEDLVRGGAQGRDEKRVEDPLIDWLESVDGRRKPRSPLEGMEDASGAEIVKVLEESGYYTFEGENADALRDAYAESLDNSPFFKRFVIDAFAENPDLRPYSIYFEDLEDGNNGKHNDEKGYIKINDDLEGGKLNYTLVHELFHSFGLRDSADMVQALEVFETESGFGGGSSKSASIDVADNVDYELFQATLDDWRDINEQLHEDYYEYDSEHTREIMEQLFGPAGRDIDPAEAFSRSTQRFDGDADRIIQAYLDARDGGKVEAIRADQLREMGIDPESIKNIDKLAEWYADNIDLESRQLASFTNEYPESVFSALADIYLTHINPAADEGEVADWIMEKISPRIENAFGENGAEAREIFDNYYYKSNREGGDKLRGIVRARFNEGESTRVGFENTLNEIASIYAGDGIDIDTRKLFGFNQGNGPIKPLFQDLVRYFREHIDPEASSEDAAAWVVREIRARLENAFGDMDETEAEKFEIFCNYIDKKDRSGKQDAYDAAAEVYAEA